ncbi:Phosphoenolpyruvate carboxylase 2 [Zea mays]|uniref:Phosphoenolpyruvate carboxylase 2 n=1 Tax=Zea mays TaxID=4577 RepID=A0A1D6LW85_MAIZE|nr:Phosphoenolpyruvate carboxylase 2 [Zea mays]
MQNYSLDEKIRMTLEAYVVEKTDEVHEVSFVVSHAPANNTSYALYVWSRSSSSQDEMCARMSYFPEAIWKGVQKFLWRIDTSLKNIGINERLPYNAPLIQFSSSMGGGRDGNFLLLYAIVYKAFV